MSSDETFFWLVGLLEGEGSFLRPSPSKPGEAKIDIEMKDEDVIKRVAALWEVSYRVRDRHRENTSITYHVRLAGRRAAALMWHLRPHLSARRQQQIDRALASYFERGGKWDPAQLPFKLARLCPVEFCAERFGECEKHAGLPVSLPPAPAAVAA